MGISETLGRDQKNPIEHRGSKNVLGPNRVVDKHCLVEVTAAADTCLVFGNELSAILNIDFTSSVHPVSC